MSPPRAQEGQRRHQIPWNWHCTWSIWVLGAKARPSAKAVSALKLLGHLPAPVSPRFGASFLYVCINSN